MGEDCISRDLFKEERKGTKSQRKLTKLFASWRFSVFALNFVVSEAVLAPLFRSFEPLDLL